MKDGVFVRKEQRLSVFKIVLDGIVGLGRERERETEIRRNEII